MKKKLKMHCSVFFDFVFLAMDLHFFSEPQERAKEVEEETCQVQSSRRGKTAVGSCMGHQNSFVITAL